MALLSPLLKDFRSRIWDYYHKEKRDLIWRKNIHPYGVVVSEIMLQQTQVARVQVKYPSFLQRFPDFATLAQATNTEVLQEWQGMGYNRRGLYLKHIAEIVTKVHQGFLPQDPETLDSFPGIGRATACAITTYAYNIPTVFIETNIRRVFLHTFFPNEKNVPDTQILPLVEQAVDNSNPRDWYYALMDYGTMLGKRGDNANKRSKHYQTQSRFEGSDRQIRSKIVQALLRQHQMNFSDIQAHCAEEKKRMQRILHGLEKDGMIRKNANGMYAIPV